MKSFVILQEGLRLPAIQVVFRELTHRCCCWLEEAHTEVSYPVLGGGPPSVRLRFGELTIPIRTRPKQNTRMSGAWGSALRIRIWKTCFPFIAHP